MQNMIYIITVGIMYDFTSIAVGIRPCINCICTVCAAIVYRVSFHIITVSKSLFPFHTEISCEMLVGRNITMYSVSLI